MNPHIGVTSNKKQPHPARDEGCCSAVPPKLPVKVSLSGSVKPFGVNGPCRLFLLWFEKATPRGYIIRGSVLAFHRSQLAASDNSRIHILFFVFYNIPQNVRFVHRNVNIS